MTHPAEDWSPLDPAAADGALAAADPDDALAEALADTLVELAAARPGPLRLAALQMAALLPPAGHQDLTVPLIARALGQTPAAIYSTQQRGLQRLRAIAPGFGLAPRDLRRPPL